ncbi:MAG: sugar ABC transporter permease [Anaerolineaceae bacterium]|nr:sugar ABC transporter permease [Anaerolineaceae bacterium]
MIEGLGGLTGDAIITTLSQIIPLIIGVVIFILALEFALYNLLAKVFKLSNALAYTLLAPAAVAILVFMIYPLLFNVLLAFSDLKRETFGCYSPVSVATCNLDHLYGLDYALDNFTKVFFRVKDGQIVDWGRLLQTAGSTFPALLGRTILWTFFNVIFHFSLGLGLALIMNQKIRFKGLYRALIVIPWALPGVITFLTWKQEFHAQYGFVNILLGTFGIEPISWLRDPLTAFIAVTFVNIWLGVPFYMVMLLGGLQSISPEYYEAAQMDGAGAWDRFRFITMPLLRPILIPAVTLDVIWTFNKLDLIIVMTNGGPQESTNILVSALYNAAFGTAATQRLGFASAFSIIIFIILFIFAIVWITTSGGLKEIYDK